MALAGGAADKLPNRYEHWWTALQIGRLLRGEASSIRLEPPGDAGEGIEFEIQFPDGPCCDQVKDAAFRWTLNRLGPVLQKVTRHLAQDKTVRLILSTDAGELALLSERARAADSFAEFEEIRTREQEEEFRVVRSNWSGVSEEEAWQYLRKIEVLPRPAESLRREVELSYAFLVSEDPEAVVALLRAFCDDHLYQVVTAPQVWSYLKSKSIKRRYLVGDQGTMLALSDTVMRVARHVRENRPVIGLAAQPHTAELIRLLQDPTGPQIVLCEGRAGMGKSTVVCDAVLKLQEQGWHAAAVRMSASRPDCLTAAALGHAMELSDSPAVVLANAAQGQAAVLVIDQLDAVSTYSGRMSEVYGAVAEVLEQLRFEPSVKVVLTARTVDITEDSRLRALAADSGRVARLVLDELSDEALQTALLAYGTDPSGLTPETLRLLKVPLHLSVFSRLSPSARAGSYRTLQQLYDQFTKERRSVVESKLTPGAWSKITNALTAYLSEHEVLAAPRLLLDDFDQTDVQRLESEGLLAAEGTRHVGFFHESYFDYLFARSFMTGHTTLHDFLVESGQALFRRSQTRQILEYTEAFDPARFRTDVRKLLDSEAIRPHIADVVIAVMRQIEPTSDDWQTVADLAWSDSPLAPKIRSLLRQPAWFDLTDRDQYWEHLLADPATAPLAFDILVSIVSDRPQRVSSLLLPYVGTSDEWRERLRRLTFWAMGPGLEPLVMKLIEEGDLDDPHGREAGGIAVLANLQSLVSREPSSATRILGAYLRRTIVHAQQSGHRDPFSAGILTAYTPAARDVIPQCASKAPVAFVTEVLPFVLDVSAAYAAQWPYLHMGSHDVGSQLIKGLAQALRTVASTQPVTFEDALERLTAINEPDTNYIVASVLTAADQSDQAVSWLLADDGLRLGIGEDVLWATRDMIKSASRDCSPAALESLLAALLGFYPSWEYPRRDRLGLLGLTQYRLLSAVEPSRRTEAVDRRLGEWQRKFGHYTPSVLEPEPSSQVRGVAPPISDAAAARMKDGDWLHALSFYAARPEDQRLWHAKGGAFELSQVLGRQAQSDPQRFAQLALALDSASPPAYFSAILQAVAPSLDRDQFAELCLHMYECIGQAAIPNICTAIQSNREKTGPALIELLEAFSKDQTPQAGYTANDDLLTAGINTNRGEVAWTAGELLSYGSQYLGALTPIVRRLAHDPSPAVRACVAHAVHALHKYDPATALNLADDLLSADLCSAPTVRHLLILALHENMNRFRHYLLEALLLPGDAGDNAGQAWALLTVWGTPMTGLPAAVQELSGPARNGAAQVFAQQPDRSLPWLVDLLNDEDSTVRESAARAIFNTDRMTTTLDDFIHAVTDSKAFPEICRSLITTLSQQPVLPHSAIEACEEAVKLQAGQPATAYYLIPLVLRLYRQSGSADRLRCLDVIDGLAPAGDLAAVDAAGR